MPSPFSVVDLPERAVMGVVNVTPDSFSDGGRFAGSEAAIAHARELVAAGADAIDVGGESTRPGAEPVALAEELRRVVPVVEALAADGAVPVSIDTSKAAVAAAALRAGARIVNDVTAGRGDPELFGVVAAADAGLAVMHMQGEPRTMQDAPHYDDVAAEVVAFLAAQLDGARVAGVRDDALLADPGIGFGKTIAHNLELLARIDWMTDALRVPVMIGASRKGFLGALTDTPRATDRDDATLATTVWSFTSGARIVRVHDVAATVRIARLLDVLERRDAFGSGGMTLRGRWAQGLQPRFFCWIIKDRLAAAERPGGFARNHRKVRRQEELIWLKSHGFTRVVSLLDSPHNLHTYEEAELVYERLPLGRHDEMAIRLRDIFEHLSRWLDDPAEKVFLHHEEFGDRVLGVLAGYLVYSGLVQEGPHAISVIEKITGRNLGADGREMVAVTLADNLKRNAGK